MDSIISSDHSAGSLRDFAIAALGVEVFMAVFFLECSVHDLSTAMFFAFGLGFLARGHYKSFFVLYLIATINRETTFLFTVFFVVFYLRRMPALQYLFRIGYQCLAFAFTRWMITSIYAGNAGAQFYFWPARVADDYVNQPINTVLLLSTCVLLGYFVYRNWNQKPAFLRLAFLVLFPLLLIMHLTVGMAFEIRVFAEVFPVVWVLIWT